MSVTDREADENLLFTGEMLSTSSKPAKLCLHLENLQNARAGT